MKETKESNTKNKIPKNNNGITLIALVITIIVMLILVSVTISMAVNGGLFDYAGKAVGDTQNALNAEQEIANGGINVGGMYYDSIDDYLKNKPSEKNYEIVSEEITGSDGNFKYVKLVNGGIQITRYIGSVTEVTIPANYDGYKVYAVGNIDATIERGSRYNIFGETNSETNTTITGIAFEEGIEKIGIAAFNECSGLTCELDFPSTLKEIGACAFSQCSNLTGDLIIPEGVTKIGIAAFQGCGSLNGMLKLSSTLEEIEDYAFTNCYEITGDLVIPEGVTKIGFASFQACNKLNGTLTLPDTLVEIEDYAFTACYSLKGNLNIPDGVTKIGKYAFDSCRSFDGELTLSTALIEVGDYAFQNCSGLTGTITLASTVTIGTDAFSGCTNLEVTQVTQ